MNGNWKRRGIAWLLTVAMLMTTVGNNWLLGSAAENDDTAVSAVQTEESSTEAAAGDVADGAEESAAAEETSGGEEILLTDVFTYGEEELTWAQAGRILAGLLGFIEEDGANVDLSAYAERISSLSLDDDSFYLAILAENGYLDGVSETIDPSAVISEDTYETLLTEAFAAAAFTQEDAEALVSQEEPENLAISGEDIFLNAYEAGRIALGESGSLELSSVTAEAISVTDADVEMDLNAAEIGRVLVNGGAEDADEEETDDAVAGTADSTDDASAGSADEAAADDTTEDVEDAADAADGTNDTADDEDAGRLYIHIDSESGLPEVILEQADDVVIEGSGSLGVVRVMGGVDSLTVRATGSVINETDADITVTGPDHEEVTLKPGEQVEFILSGYLVSFVTDGTPVESQTVSPGSAVDFTLAQTELEGMIFTAWYTDEDYTEPYSMLNTVDEETTLYARFVDEADAVTVTFETFGGRELEPLVFARGETLLTKDISSLYTSKEGYTFSGWCVDEDCTEAFGYSQAIEESMILYAFYVSDEIQEEEQEGTVAELVDLDWQGSIGLILPDGMTILEAMEHVSIAAGTGGEDPEISFRETDNGTEIYGTYHNEGGESGFEPGATFTVTVSDGICFDGYEEYIDTLTVSVYKEEVELVEYSEDLIWVNWEHVSDLVPVSGGTTSYVGELTADSVDTEEEVEEEVIPGSLTLDSGIQVAVGDIVAFYDGSIDDDEESILSWEGGTLDGYSMYVEITEVEESDAGTEISFINASPTEYITDLDVHITNEVNLEDSISEAQITKIEQSITTQVRQNEELSAQMQIAVMTSQKTQDMLDETYGVGVYSLASSMGSSSSIDVDT
ncbi:MAG: InlB B-repeat-containing protein, partial [Lachnospiraceae bacterium]|nr:InlB B-repeat-containing protein [Lachnospiraceae bacterium]